MSAVTDVRTAKIRNNLFIAGVILGLVLNIAMDGWRGTYLSLLGLALPILVFLPFSSNRFKLFGFHGIKVVGMGDVKLFGFMGALLCFPDVFKVIFLTYVLGGVYSLILMLRKKILIKRLAYFFSWLKGYFKTSGNNEYASAVKMKFAPFVFFAVSAYCLYHWFFPSS